MKKTCIFLILMILTISAFSQRKFSPGIRVGIQSTTITESGLGLKFGFYATGFYEMRFGKVYILQPEVSFLSQGASGIIEDFWGGKAAGKVDLNYASFGLINKFALGKHFRLYTGPAFEYLLNDSYWVDSKIDVSVSTGAEYKFDSGLGIELRAKQGILNVLDISYIKPSSSSYNFSNTRNMGIQLGVNYRF